MTASRSPTPTTAGGRKATFLLRQPRLAQGFREPLRLQAGAPAADDPALTMIWIPPGRFWMGSPAKEEGRAETEGPLHLVQLQGFFMSQTPITQAQWRVVAQWKMEPGEEWQRGLDENPSRFRSDSKLKLDKGIFHLLESEETSDHRPVENVDWNDAVEFCDVLSQRTGHRYSLPTEAQWEFACRASTSTAFFWGDMLTEELANYDASHTDVNGLKGVYRQQTSPVRSFPPNPWGLHDMHGNVWEWCLDDWHDSYEGAPTDGSAWLYPDLPSTGWSRPYPQARTVIRGGSWLDRPRACRSAARDWQLPGGGGNEDVGFRVVCLPHPQNQTKSLAQNESDFQEQTSEGGQIPIEKLQLSTRTSKRLKLAKVNQVTDLMGYSYDDLLNIMDAKAADEVIESLERVGISLPAQRIS